MQTSVVLAKMFQEKRKALGKRWQLAKADVIRVVAYSSDSQVADYLFWATNQDQRDW